MPNSSSTQGLGTASFYTSHTGLLEKQDRLRVAEQLISLLLYWYKNNIKLKKSHILDVGCSNGIITHQISEHAASVTGVDVDEDAIGIAKNSFKKNKKLHFYSTKGTKLQFEENSFDVVICNQVYSYAAEPKKLMDEIYRVLKKDGICLFTGDNLLRPIEPLYNIPFLRLLPKSISFLLLRILGYKNIYLGNYKTYWGIKNLFKEFLIYDLTIDILKSPGKFHYKKLEKYSTFINFIPTPILKIIEPLFPSFIFILQKN